MFRQRCSAARAPWHRLIFLPQPAVFIALFQKMPDTLNVDICVCIVRVIPIHPLAEPFGLFGNNPRKALNSVNAFTGKFRHAVLLNIPLADEAELFFNFDFNPKALGIKTVLASAGIALHSFVSYKNILKAPAPCMVNAHGIVGGYGAVQKTEPGIVLIFLTKHFKTVVLFPEL